MTTTTTSTRCVHKPGPVQVVLDEPATVHYIGVLQSRDQGPPSSSAVYSWLGLNGLPPDFNGTINATQAGVPFSSGQCMEFGSCLQLSVLDCCPAAPLSLRKLGLRARHCQAGVHPSSGCMSIALWASVSGSACQIVIS